MPQQRKKPISNMPTENWFWETGEYEYINSAGIKVTGRGKHFHNIATGENLTTREGQILQRKTREQLGIPKPEPIARTPRRRFIRFRAVPSRKGRPSQHGRTVNIYYRDLEEAQLDFQELYQDPNSFVHAYRAWIIEISWQTKNTNATTNTSEKKRLKNGRLARIGYATLSPRWYNLRTMGTQDTPWLEAWERLPNYNMGSLGRIIVFGGEQ